MPLELKPPRKGRTPYWFVRGTYLGQYVEQSTRTREKRIAKQVLEKIQNEIERGEFARPAVEPVKTFAAIATSYMEETGVRGARIEKLLLHFGEKPVEEIDQSAIGRAATTLMPDGSAPTRNREIYTPMSAILKHAGITFQIKRPKGWRGTPRIDWLEPEEAVRVLAAAKEIDEEFAIFLTTLLFTGMRLSEATIHFKLAKLSLATGYAYVPITKNGEPRAIHLPPTVVAAIACHPRGLDRPGETVFRFRKCGRLYTLLGRVAKASGRELTFHLFRHTYGALMRRYGKLDTTGLIATGAWKDPASVRRYEHAVQSEEAMKADLLPIATPWGKSAS